MLSTEKVPIELELHFPPFAFRLLDQMLELSYGFQFSIISNNAKIQNGVILVRAPRHNPEQVLG